MKIVLLYSIPPPAEYFREGDSFWKEVDLPEGITAGGLLARLPSAREVSKYKLFKFGPRRILQAVASSETLRPDQVYGFHLYRTTLASVNSFKKDLESRIPPKGPVTFYHAGFAQPRLCVDDERDDSPNFYPK